MDLKTNLERQNNGSLEAHEHVVRAWRQSGLC